MPSAREIVENSRREIVKEVIEDMKRGYFFAIDRWNKEALRPQNPITQVKYQGINRIRLAFQAKKMNYQDPRWITFLQAKEQGWKVKNEENGTVCEKWIWTKEKIEKDEDGNEKKTIINLRKPIVYYFTLFNAEQIEGIPKLEKKQMNETELGKVADDFIKSSECEIVEKVQDESYYIPSEDKIVLPPREYFKSEESFLGTLFHEMSHSTGHQTRLNRDIVNEFGTVEYANEELRAELGAMFIEADLNLDFKENVNADHTNYLKSWISVLEDNPDELFKAGNDSSKISERLIDNYNKCIQLENNKIKQVEIVILNDTDYGKNSLWRVPLNKFKDGEIGTFIMNLTNEELEDFKGYVKEEYSSNVIYNNLLEYLQENNISFEDLIQEEIEEMEILGG